MKTFKEHKFLFILSIIILIAVVSLVILFVVFGNKNGKWIKGGEDTMAAYRARILANGNIELGFDVSKLGDDKLYVMGQSDSICIVNDSGVNENWHTYIIEPQKNFNFNFQVSVYSKEDYELLNDSGKTNLSETGGFVKIARQKYIFNMSVFCDSEGKATIDEIACYNNADEEKREEITANGCTIKYPVSDNQPAFGEVIEIQGGKKGEWSFTTDENMYICYGYTNSGIMATLFIGEREDTEELLVYTAESGENTDLEEEENKETYQVPDNFESEVVLNNISGDTEIPVLRLKVTCKDGFIVKIEKK